MRYIWSDSIKVHPWVGEYYENPRHVLHKTLILGESNFTEPSKFNSGLVQECVRDDMSTDRSRERDTTGFCRFSTKIRRIIFGSKESVGPAGLWQDVAFYNFVQTLVGGAARMRPTQEMWDESVPAFVEIVTALKPTKILVLGKANWNNLLAHVEHEAVESYKCLLKIGSDRVAAGYVNHPSSSLSYSKWQPVAKAFLFS